MEMTDDHFKYLNHYKRVGRAPYHLVIFCLGKQCEYVTFQRIANTLTQNENFTLYSKVYILMID